MKCNQACKEGSKVLCIYYHKWVSISSQKRLCETLGRQRKLKES